MGKNYTGVGCYCTPARDSFKKRRDARRLDDPYDHIGPELFGNLAILAAKNSIRELKKGVKT